MVKRQTERRLVGSATAGLAPPRVEPASSAAVCEPHGVNTPTRRRNLSRGVSRCCMAPLVFNIIAIIGCALVSWTLPLGPHFLMTPQPRIFPPPVEWDSAHPLFFYTNDVVSREYKTGQRCGLCALVAESSAFAPTTLLPAFSMLPAPLNLPPPLSLVLATTTSQPVPNPSSQMLLLLPYPKLGTTPISLLFVIFSSPLPVPSDCGCTLLAAFIHPTDERRFHRMHCIHFSPDVASCAHFAPRHTSSPLHQLFFI